MQPVRVPNTPEMWETLHYRFRESLVPRTAGPFPSTTDMPIAAVMATIATLVPGQPLFVAARAARQAANAEGEHHYPEILFGYFKTATATTFAMMLLPLIDAVTNATTRDGGMWDNLPRPGFVIGSMTRAHPPTVAELRGWYARTKEDVPDDLETMLAAAQGVAPRPPRAQRAALILHRSEDAEHRSASHGPARGDSSHFDYEDDHLGHGAAGAIGADLRRRQLHPSQHPVDDERRHGAAVAPALPVRQADLPLSFGAAAAAQRAFEDAYGRPGASAAAVPGAAGAPAATTTTTLTGILVTSLQMTQVAAADVAPCLAYTQDSWGDVTVSLLVPGQDPLPAAVSDSCLAWLLTGEGYRREALYDRLRREGEHYVGANLANYTGHLKRYRAAGMLARALSRPVVAGATPSTSADSFVIPSASSLRSNLAPLRLALRDVEAAMNGFAHARGVVEGHAEHLEPEGVPGLGPDQRQARTNARTRLHASDLHTAVVGRPTGGGHNNNQPHAGSRRQRSSSGNGGGRGGQHQSFRGGNHYNNAYQQPEPATHHFKRRSRGRGQGGRGRGAGRGAGGNGGGRGRG